MHELRQCVEDAPSIRAHRHRGAQRNLSRVLGHGLVERALPRTSDVDAEIPGTWRKWFVAAEDA
jgi:hypothetical protein